MNSTTKSIRRPTITLALPRSVPALISYAQDIVTRMTGNPSFPAPVFTLAAAVQVPRRDQDGRGRLEPAHVADGPVNGRPRRERPSPHPAAQRSVDPPSPIDPSPVPVVASETLAS
jgi:hypothetical protein